MEQLKLNARGVSYGHVQGTLWKGSVHDVIVANQPIGRVDLKTRPLSVLSLSPTLEWSFAGPVGSGRGVLLTTLSNDIELSNTIVDLNVQALARLDARLRQAPSKVSLTIRALETRTNGECRSATGNLSTDILSSLGGRYAWEGPNMIGEIRCENLDYLVTLQNDGGPDDVSASIQIEPSGLFDVSALMVPTNANVQAALPVIGFTQGETGYEYSYTNRNVQETFEGSD